MHSCWVSSPFNSWGCFRTSPRVHTHHHTEKEACCSSQAWVCCRSVFPNPNTSCNIPDCFCEVNPYLKEQYGCCRLKSSHGPKCQLFRIRGKKEKPLLNLSHKHFFCCFFTPWRFKRVPAVQRAAEQKLERLEIWDFYTTTIIFSFIKHSRKAKW